MRLAPALRKKRAISGSCPTGQLPLALGITARTLLPDRATRTPPPLRHTNGGVLAEPSYNSKKWGLGQRIPPHPQGNRIWISQAQTAGRAADFGGIGQIGDTENSHFEGHARAN